ncbi:hypothetical protein [Bacteroides sp.]|uniref:hypothetical protein n=1 Tax=Bacteroides sp. TaxID=29523 RepID=UPI003D0F0D22
MIDLFGNNEKQSRIYRRDSVGRFAGVKQAIYEKALREAAMYKQLYLKELSRSRGIAKMIRIKDELINNLKK